MNHTKIVILTSDVETMLYLITSYLHNWFINFFLYQAIKENNFIVFY